MGMLSGNKMNYWIEKYILPLKSAITGKFDTSKIVPSVNITEPGFAMDGKTCSEALTSLNSKFVVNQSTESILIDSNARADLTVTFPIPFLAVPTIVAVPYTSTGGAVEIAVKNITKTSFVVNMKNTGGSAAYFKVNYIASA